MGLKAISIPLIILSFELKEFQIVQGTEVLFKVNNILVFMPGIIIINVIGCAIPSRKVKRPCTSRLGTNAAVRRKSGMYMAINKLDSSLVVLSKFINFPVLFNTIIIKKTKGGNGSSLKI